MKRSFVLYSLWLIGTAACGLARGAANVDTAQVVDAVKRGAIVWDVRAAADYKKGHIPGAVNIDDAGKVLRDPNSEDFIATSKIEKILGDAGIDPSKEVIVYGGRGSPYADFGRYALRYFGARNVSVYHDGIDAWRSAGRPVTTEESSLPPVTLKLTPTPAVAATTAEVAQRTASGAVQIIDARTPDEYLGEDIRAIRGGHVPGAVNIPYEQNWKDPETPQKLAKRKVADNSGMALKSNDELKQIYSKLDPEKDTVVYCQSGVRASQTASVLEDLGFKKVRVYDSSWLGYAAKLDAPADNETFFNVGLMNAKFSALLKRVDELERQLAESRTVSAVRARCAPGERC